ncbi:hypothetical protein CSC94_22840 [Zhengella mangrovi]|uniref:DUF924 domain-containing protein n=1 Tax=Zhengella mangrovi TaxID=1982044 RepID=A0A2G1QGS7_9HYPH|nr:DUF924 family protein [Zhengella mangrovi]PHP64715.1 hypothetical protein CSC94_22840 [Zhengella mangrovi]
MDTIALPTSWKTDVLHFWFDELTPEDWFNGSDTLDGTITRRFREIHDQVAHQPPDDVWHEADSALAAIIVLDQFPRNMFRRQARAFATDTLAAQITHNAVDKGLDRSLDDDRKQFLYMPLMHSERLDDQERCVSLFEALGREKNLEFAREHRDVIARFGRFPHRNEALGRSSSEDELAYLEEARRYGQ